MLLLGILPAHSIAAFSKGHYWVNGVPQSPTELILYGFATEVLLAELDKKQKILGLKSSLILRYYDCVSRKSNRIYFQIIKIDKSQVGNALINFNNLKIDVLYDYKLEHQTQNLKEKNKAYWVGLKENQGQKKSALGRSNHWC